MWPEMKKILIYLPFQHSTYQKVEVPHTLYLLQNCLQHAFSFCSLETIREAAHTLHITPPRQVSLLPDMENGRLFVGWSGLFQRPSVSCSSKRSSSPNLNWFWQQHCLSMWLKHHDGTFAFCPIYYHTASYCSSVDGLQQGSHSINDHHLKAFKLVSVKTSWSCWRVYPVRSFTITSMYKGFLIVFDRLVGYFHGDDRFYPPALPPIITNMN